MSTATPPAAASDRKTVAPSYALPALGGEAHFLLRRLHSLTGIIFGGYIVVHLLVNATLLEATRYPGQATIFQQQVDKIHSIPWLFVVEWTAIILPLVYHTVYGIWITFTGQPNVRRYAYTKNIFYTLQRGQRDRARRVHRVPRPGHEGLAGRRAGVRAGRARHRVDRPPICRRASGSGG